MMLCGSGNCVCWLRDCEYYLWGAGQYWLDGCVCHGCKVWDVSVCVCKIVESSKL
jgi:hypothetical protein